MRSNISNSEQYSSRQGAASVPSYEVTSPYQLHTSSPNPTDNFQDERSNDDLNGDDNVYKISLTEILYSSSSYHAIVKPGEYKKYGCS